MLSFEAFVGLMLPLSAPLPSNGGAIRRRRNGGRDHKILEIINEKCPGRIDYKWPGWIDEAMRAEKSRWNQTTIYSE